MAGPDDGADDGVRLGSAAAREIFRHGGSILLRVLEDRLQRWDRVEPALNVAGSDPDPRRLARGGLGNAEKGAGLEDRSIRST